MLYASQKFDGKEEKKCIGVKSNIVKRCARFQDYIKCLLTKK